LDKILKWVKHNEYFLEDYPEYSTFDFFEIEPITDEIINALIKMMQNAKNDPEIISDATSVLGWSKVSQYLKRRTAKKDKIKKGDFGEALINHILQKHFGYKIPVHKLRFKLSSDQSLPAMDSIALKINDEGIIELCYIESKTATKYTTSEMQKAYVQLQEDYDKEIPDMIIFILEIVKNSDKQLYDYLMLYLKDRELKKDKDKFIIEYTCEKLCWTFGSMENLKEVIDDEYPDTILSLMRIKDLEKKIYNIVSEIGDELIE
jgi:hypothetical protein